MPGLVGVKTGRRRIAPMLAEFAKQHQGPEAHLVLSDAGLEVGQDGIDVALRIDRPEGPAIIARKIASAPRVLCGTPSYLTARGVPETPADLTGHECLPSSRAIPYRHAFGCLWISWRHPDCAETDEALLPASSVDCAAAE